MTFLQTVAKDILAKHGTRELSNIAIVFPNKRASLFLNQALYEQARKPIWSPSYFTISDLFRRHSKLVVPDQISLIFKLYNIFISKTQSTETLDHFYSWGQLMLSDFDDLDKNLVNSKDLFVNLKEWERLKGDLTFLNQEQRECLEEFFGKVSDQTELQRRYNAIWENMGEIYESFHNSLIKEGLAYEGMLYRNVVEKKPKDFNFQHYIFIGFNLLQKVEQKLFSYLKDLGKAEFYWDYDESIMEAPQEAGRYVSKYLDKFPNELGAGRCSSGINPEEVYNQLSTPKDITYLSAPTEDIQSRYVTTWLRERLVLAQNDPVANSLQRIAVILGDERLLQNVIHCLPSEATKVNITTGYPLSASPVATFVSALIDLQLQGITKDGNHYRLRYINRVLRHPYAKYLSEDCATLCQHLNDHKAYYPSRKSLIEGQDGNIISLFKSVKMDSGYLLILPWVADILQRIGIGSRDAVDALTSESIFRIYTLINRLNDIMVVAPNAAMGVVDGKQIVGTSILQRLIEQLVDSTTIPFHGEPAIGIQIMGVLETRNLDFDHVLMLSCNEGNLPKGINDASFIPHSLRRGFEMTTIENKVAVYAYYFYSIMQRAGDITLSFNNATDEGRQGEMSRFMLQFMVDNGGHHAVKRKSILSGQEVAPINRCPVEKNGIIKEKLDSLKTISPTALSRYLRCNLQFYYNVICGLHEPDDNDVDEIDFATFGNIFHRAAELIYGFLSGENYNHVVTQDDIKSLLANRQHIDVFIDQAFKEELFKIKDNSFQPRYNGLQLLSRNVIRLYIYRLLRYDMRHAPIKLLALEEKFYKPFSFEANGKTYNLKLGGQIDRLDSILENGRQIIRVIDYKTGIPLTSTPPAIDEIFKEEFVDSKHTVYYLQTFLYSSIIRFDKTAIRSVNPHSIPVAPALLFIREASKDDYDPVLQLLKEPKSRVRVSDIKDVAEEYEKNLRNLLQKIFDLSEPFMPTNDETRCANCPYSKICSL